MQPAAQSLINRGSTAKKNLEQAGYKPTQSVTGTSWAKPAAVSQEPEWGDPSTIGVGRLDSGSTPAPKQRAAVHVPTAAEKQAAKDAAERNSLRGGINMTSDELMQAFDLLFNNLDTLLKDRAGQTEKDYGDQLTKTASDYADSLPQIQASYAALGAGDSTDQGDAKDKAKEGFDTATSTINKNKEGDLAKIGQYGLETKAKYNADKDSVNRIKGRVGEVEDLGELRQTRNDFENKLGSVRADIGTLNTDTGARGELSKLTSDSGRYDSVTNALDAILKGSMSGAVKDAAVKAVVDNGGLSDEDKKKVQAQYGNTYAEQATL